VNLYFAAGPDVDLEAARIAARPGKFRITLLAARQRGNAQSLVLTEYCVSVQLPTPLGNRAIEDGAKGHRNSAGSVEIASEILRPDEKWKPGCKRVPRLTSA
jgi:hypothetical protein